MLPITNPEHDLPVRSREADRHRIRMGVRPTRCLAFFLGNGYPGVNTLYQTVHCSCGGKAKGAANRKDVIHSGQLHSTPRQCSQRPRSSTSLEPRLGRVVELRAPVLVIPACASSTVIDCNPTSINAFCRRSETQKKP